MQYTSVQMEWYGNRNRHIHGSHEGIFLCLWGLLMGLPPFPPRSLAATINHSLFIQTCSSTHSLSDAPAVAVFRLSSSFLSCAFLHSDPDLLVHGVFYVYKPSVFKLIGFQSVCLVLLKCLEQSLGWVYKGPPLGGLADLLLINNQSLPDCLPLQIVNQTPLWLSCGFAYSFC